MSYVLILMIAGQLAAAYGPSPAEVYLFPTKVECEAEKIKQIRHIREVAPDALDDPAAGVAVKCVDEKTFMGIVSGKGEQDKL